MYNFGAGFEISWEFFKTFFFLGVSFHLYLDTYLKAYLYNIHLDILLLAKEGRTLQKYEAYAWWNVPMKCFKFFYFIWFYLVVSNSTIWLKNEEQKELCFCNQKIWQILKDFAGIFHPAYVHFFLKSEGQTRTDHSNVNIWNVDPIQHWKIFVSIYNFR